MINYLVFLCMIVAGFAPLGVEIWPGVASTHSSDFDELPVRAVRTYIRWNEVEQARGVYTWDASRDAEFQFLGSRGINPLIVSIHDTPAFYRRPGENRSCAPPDEKYMAEFGAFVRAVSARFPMVSVWEFWNEPEFANGQDGYYGCWGSYGGQTYGRFLKTFYDAVKAADPRDRVMFGSLGNGDASFMRQAAQVTTAWDVTGIHVYADGSKSFDAVLAETSALVNELNAINYKPVWITETSYLSNVTTSEAEQAQVDWLNYAVDEFSPYYHVIIWYGLADPEWRNAGMYDGERRKPVWYEFQRVSK